MPIVKTDNPIALLYAEALEATIAEKRLFMSPLVDTGAVVISDTFDNRVGVGDKINVPYWSMMGGFEETADGVAATTEAKITASGDEATVKHATLRTSVTRWSRAGVAGDVLQVAQMQIQEQASHYLDDVIIAAGAASTGLAAMTNDVYSSGAPRTISLDLITRTRIAAFGDQNDGIAALIVHSKVEADLLNLRTEGGAPLLVFPQDGSIPRVAGIPLIVSDKAPVGGTLPAGAITSTGTTPPAITLTGTPKRVVDLRVECTTGGARGTAVIRYSTDGGVTWVEGVTTAATIAVRDSKAVSFGEAYTDTGVTINYANASANVDNRWSHTVPAAFESLIVKRSALGFWFNRAAMAPQFQDDVDADVTKIASHLYYVPVRFRRAPGSMRPGVAKLRTN